MNLKVMLKALLDLKMSEVITDKATLIYDADILEEGVEVFVQDPENADKVIPAEDGEYTIEEEKKIVVVKDGKVAEVKEIRITPNIEEHDFGFKAKNARKFIEDGNKVKITVRFRGRELNNTKMGEEVLNQFIKNLEDISVVEKKPKLEGKNMFIILAKKAN